MVRKEGAATFSEEGGDGGVAQGGERGEDCMHVRLVAFCDVWRGDEVRAGLASGTRGDWGSGGLGHPR
jgi:hypothetical protein